MAWVGPSAPRSATCVADDVKEGGLGLGFSEPDPQLHQGVSCAPVQLQIPHPGFCAALSSDLSLLLPFWCCCSSLAHFSLHFPVGRIACFHCHLARTPLFLSPRKPQCDQEDAVAGRAIRSSGEASWVGRAPLIQIRNRSPLLLPSSCCLSLPQASGLGRCVLSWMAGIQSRCTVPTGQRPPPCAGRGPSIPLPHLC